MVMDRGYINIIDRTLIILWKIYGENLNNKILQLRELVKIIYEVGSTIIEINSDLYEMLYPIPEEVKFFINNNKDIELGLYPNLNIRYDSTNIFSEKLTISGLDNLILYDYEKVFNEIRLVIKEDFNMCIGNKYNCATALTLEWIRLNGKNVVTTFTGIGEYAALEEVIGSLNILYSMNIRSNLKLLPYAKKLFEDITKIKISPNKPLIGRSIFEVESGVHVDGIIKNYKNFEPYKASLVGMKRKIIVGKFSGVKAIDLILNELNVKFDKDSLNDILNEVRVESINKERSLSYSELVDISKKIVKK